MDKLSVRAGSNKAESGGQQLNVSKIIIHEKFKGGYPYDIALIKTGEEIEFGKNAKPIRLAKSKPKKGTKAQITGYGDTLVRLVNIHYSLNIILSVLSDKDE